MSESEGVAVGGVGASGECLIEFEFILNLIRIYSEFTVNLSEFVVI